MNMRFVNFFALDFVGAALYILLYCGLGWFFRDSLALLTNRYQEAGRLVGWLLAFGIILYFGNRFRLLLKAGASSYVPRVSAVEIARRFNSGLPHDMALYDVRSHGYYSKRSSRIRGSLRLEPNTLLQQIENLPKDKEIILYCTCQGEATSLRVARVLQQHGCRAAVIKGGLSAWKRGGFPMETVPPEDVVLMPTF
jgi:rhodanese-related sulfurtransferase